MSFANNLYDTHTLMGLYREVEAPSTFFRDTCYGSVVTFEDEYIDFEKVARGRKLAPLVIPTSQGRPVTSEASVMQRFKPAYVKPKDAVSPGRVIKRRPGEGLLAPNALTPQQRYDAIVGDIVREHRETIDRREEWLCARAVIDGALTLSGPDYPTSRVDYRRDPSHTVALSGAAAWNSGSYAGSRLKDIQGWINRVRRAKFGGPVTRVVVGAAVLEYLLADDDVQKQLDMNVRGTNANLNTGLLSGDHIELIGYLGPNVQLIVNTDYYELPDGTTETFVGAGDVVLLSPNLNGVRAYGAILDEDAGFKAQAVFTKMWRQPDPSATFVMSQSAPLPVVVNPNSSLKATVLA